MNSHAIYLTQTPGRCRWCRCTYDNPCAAGCGWANREQTLCTECVPLDRAMKNAPGRMELAEFLQEHGFLTGGRRHAELTRGPRLKAPAVRAKACARSGCREPRLPRHQLCRIHSMSKTALGA